MERVVRIGLIQMSCSRDIETNLNKAVQFIQQAAEQGVQIICLQELFKSHYFCQMVDSQLLELAESAERDSPIVQGLAQLAAKLQIVIVAPLFEKRVTGLYHNTAIVLDADGSYLGKYRKMHIPEDPLYYEKFYFAPGDLGYQTFRTRYANIGVLICWDQWFPEAARITAMKGAEIIFYPTAIGFTPPEIMVGGEEYQHAWQIVQQGHAVANSCFVATVNRVGFEENPDRPGGIDFWGSSFVSDPHGQIVVKASREEDEILVCTLDLLLIKTIRRGFGFPFRDRRIDSYDGLSELYLDNY